jgi:hypothetical protein
METTETVITPPISTLTATQVAPAEKADTPPSTPPPELPGIIILKTDHKLTKLAVNVIYSWQFWIARQPILAKLYPNTVVPFLLRVLIYALFPPRNIINLPVPYHNTTVRKNSHFTIIICSLLSAFCRCPLLN